MAEGKPPIKARAILIHAKKTGKPKKRRLELVTEGIKGRKVEKTDTLNSCAWQKAAKTDGTLLAGTNTESLLKKQMEDAFVP